MNERPCEGYSPRFSNCLNTKSLLRLGANVASGMMIAKRPKMCSISIVASKRGSSKPPRVLISTAIVIVAHAPSTKCQGAGVYSGLATVARPTNKLDVMYAPDAVLACQPQRVNQPVSNQYRLDDT